MLPLKKHKTRGGKVIMETKPYVSDQTIGGGQTVDCGT